MSSDLTNIEIGTQFTLFADMEAPQPNTTYTTAQLAMEAIAVSEPSQDAQPDMFGEEYFK